MLGLSIATATLLAAGPVDAVPRPQTCRVEATLAGIAAFDSVEGVQRDALILSDAQAACMLPAVVVVASAWSPLFVAGTPIWDVGARYRFEVAPSARAGIGVVALTSPVVAVAGAAGGEVEPKAGNNVPPCAQADALRWRASAVTLLGDVRPLDGLDAASLTEAWSLAASAWSAPACGNAEVAIVPSPSVEDWRLAADGRSTIAFERAESSIFSELGLADGLGFTCWVCDDTGAIVEADVRLDGVGVAWENSCSAAAYDVQAVAVHEVGHVLGFAHSADTAAVMFARTSERRLLDARRPKADDVATLCARYPCTESGCESPYVEQPSCPSGAAVCAACDQDEACGAVTDRCLRATDGAASICSRSCSSSFPCPTGTVCQEVGAATLQCVPEVSSCPDRSFVGAACASDADCGGAGDLCNEDGRCGAACDGLACPLGALCVVERDANGLVVRAQCEGEHLPASKGGAKGGRCASASVSAPWAWLGLLVLLVRRRVC